MVDVVADDGGVGDRSSMMATFHLYNEREVWCNDIQMEKKSGGGSWVI